MHAGAARGGLRAPGGRAAARVDDVDRCCAMTRSRRAMLARITSGFFDASGSATCVPPARSTSNAIGPPAEATTARQPCATSACVISTVHAPRRR